MDKKRIKDLLQRKREKCDCGNDFEYIEFLSPFKNDWKRENLKLLCKRCKILEEIFKKEKTEEPRLRGYIAPAFKSDKKVPLIRKQPKDKHGILGELGHDAEVSDEEPDVVTKNGRVTGFKSKT